MPNTDIEILVGVQGGASIKNGSGKLIRNQIEGIIRQTQRQLKLELSVNEKLIQDQITNAIKKMPAVKIAVTPDFGDGVSKNGKGSSGKNGGKATGAAASYQAEINKIGRIVADANKTNLKVFDVQETSKQRKEIERQVNSALVSVENAEKKLSETSKKPIASIQKAVQMVPAVVKSENDRAMKVAAVNDEYDKQIAKLKEVRQAAESANTSLSSNASDRTKGSDTYKAYSEQLKFLNNESERILSQSFNENSARSQINDVESLIGLYKELEGIVRSVQQVENSIRNSDAGQLQNIADLQAQKYKLLTTRAGYSQDSEIYKYLSGVIDNVSSSIQEAKKNYSELTGVAKTSINEQVNGFKQVQSAADSFRRKLSSNEDIYNANIKKLVEMKNAASKAFGEASNNYGGTNAATYGVSAEWNTYVEMQQRVAAETEKILSGSFDRNNSQGQIDQIQRVITSYNDLDSALKKVNVSQRQYATANSKADNASLAMQKVAARTYEFYQKIKDTASPEFQSRVLALFDSTRLNNYSGDAKKATAELVRLENEAYACGYAQESLGQKISRVFKQKFGYLIMAVAAMKLRQGLQQVYKNVVDIDTAMTELKKVTDETASTYNKFLDGAADRAKMLGATLSDTVTATADFARLGYSLDEASNLADSAIVYKNVGDGIDSINDASESVISTMKAFNVEATKSMNIVDKFNEVGNNFAISSKGVGDALLNSASALAAANNDLDQSIALVTAANSVVQDPTKVGTALKTVSMYLRAAKSEAEDAGESTDGMAESVSKLQKEILTLTNNQVDIMVDPQNFKSTYDILKELSKVWDQLSDVTQANILEKIGGKRNANVVSAILTNFSIAEEALATSQESAGSALAENEKYLDSINGKIATMQASFQKLSANLLDSSIVKGFYTAITALIDALNWANDATGGFVSNIAMVSAAVLGLIIVFNVLKASALSGVLASIGTMITSLGELVSCLFVTAGGAEAAGAAIGSMNTALLGWIGIAAIAVVGAFQLYQSFANTQKTVEEMSEDVDSMTSELSSLRGELDANIDRLVELRTLAENGQITIVEENELKRLEQQNALLEKQIQLKEEALNIAKKELSDTSISYINGAAEDVRGSTTVDEYGNQVAGTSRIDAFYEDIERYKKAKEDYTNAITSGDDEVIASSKKTMNAIEESLNSQMSRMLELASDVDASTEQGQDAINTVSKAYNKYRLTLDGVSNAQDVFNDVISSSEYADAVSFIRELGDVGELTTDSLINLYKTNPEVRKLLDYLASEGLISLGNLTSVVNQFNKSADATHSQLMSLSDVLSAIKGPCDMFNKAIKETAEDGYVSIDTLEELTSKYPALEKYLTKTAGGYKMTSGALKEYMASQRQEYEVAFNEAKMAAVDIINKQDGIKSSYDDSTEAIYRRIRALKDEAAAELAIAGKDIMAKGLAAGDTVREIQSYASYQAAVQAASEKYKAITQAINDMDTANQNLQMFDRAASSAGRDAKNGISQSGTDKYKQEVEKQIKILQHKREMDLLTDRQYFEKLREIEKKYYLDSEQHKSKYAEEIWDLDQEIFNGMRDIRTDWFSDQEKMAENFSLMGDINSQRMIYEDILKEAEKAIDEAHEYGLDENSDYVQELRDQYHKTCQAIVSMIQDAYDDFKSYADDFNMWGKFDFTQVEFLEKNLREIKKLYEEGKLGWTEYVEAYNKVAKDLYDTKKDSIETIIDMTMQMIEQEANDEIDALDDQIDKLGKIIDLKKKLLQDTNDEADHEKKVADAVAEIAKLQSKIAQLSLDDSRSAYAQRVDLESQLADKQKELADLQSEYTLDKTMDTLDETKQAKEDAAEDEKEAIEKSIDSWVKKYNLAIKKIDGDWDGLYKDLNNWMAEHRDSIDGPDSLKTAWENVDQMVRQTGQDIESIYNGNGNIGINPNSPQSILNTMKQNSEIAKANGSAQFNGRNLHEENNKLAAQYEKLTGIKLTYDSSKGWLKPDGSLAYTISGSSSVNTIPSSGSSSVITASYGEQGSSNVRWIQSKLASYGLKQPVDGNYWQTTAANVAAFAKDHGITTNGKSFTKELYELLKKYHTGGIVDGTGSLNDKEVLAILKKGELVLNDGQKANLHSVMQSLSDAVTVVNRTKSLFSKNAYGATQNMTTFAPQLSVTISHNGKMTDADADRYGNRIGNIALETMYKTMRTRGIKG